MILYSVGENEEWITYYFQSQIDYLFAVMVDNAKWLAKKQATMLLLWTGRFVPVGEA
jgi:hypothetical protein